MWLVLALACLLPAVPGLAAGPAPGVPTPAAGVHRYLSGIQRIAGADGSLWRLGAWASEGDAATDRTVYVVLERCPGLYEFCDYVGAWQVHVASDAIQFAPDLSTASFQATVGGIPLAMSLHTSGPAYTAEPVGDVRNANADPAVPPTASVQLNQGTPAAGTFTFAGNTCHAEQAEIGQNTGVDSTGQPRPENGFYWTHATSGSYSTTVPNGIAVGLSQGPYGPPHCLQEGGVGDGGQPITVKAGAYSGRFTVPAGGSLDGESSLINIDDLHRDAVAILLVKRVGDAEMSWTQVLQRTPPEWPTEPPFTVDTPHAPSLPAGTYEFVLASNYGVTAHLFTSTPVQVTGLRPDTSWRLSYAKAEPKPGVEASTTLTQPFTKAANTFGVMLATYITVATDVPSAHTYQVKDCFRLQGETCDNSGSELDGKGVSYSPFGDAVQVSTDPEYLGYDGTIPDGAAEAAIDMSGNEADGHLILVSLTGPFS